MASAEAVAAVIEAGGAHVPELLDRLEVRLAEVAASHGAVLAEHAGATIAAGGKRLRPLLVFVAAGSRASDGVLRAAVAVELVHSATLVHDDVLDAAPAAARPADGGRRRGPRAGDRHRRPAVLARVRRAGAPTGAPTRCACSPTPRPRWPQGELMQRADAWNVGVSRERYLRALRPQDRAAVRGRLPARRARGRRAGRAAGAVRPPDRARVPAARRRARRLRPGGAHRQAPRHRPARRHGHAAADPRARARSGAGRARPARRADARGRRRRCATRSPPRGRWRSRGRMRSRWSRTRRPICRSCRTAQRAALELVADGVVDRYSARSPSARWVRGERGGEALDLVLHVGVREAREVLDQALGAAVELLVEAIDDGLVEDRRGASTRSWGSAGAPPTGSGRPPPTRPGTPGSRSHSGHTCRSRSGLETMGSASAGAGCASKYTTSISRPEGRTTRRT